MSQRDWREYTPLGVGLAVIIAFVATGLVNHQKQSQRGESRAKKHSEYALNRASPIARHETPPRNPNSERDEWRAEQDLDAQWEMAKWAKVAALAAVLTAVMTGLGVWFVKRTLDATRQAVKEAEEGTKAANRAVEVTRDALFAERRPWLKVRAVRFSDFYTEPTRVVVGVRVVVENVGNSPAHDIDLKLKIVDDVMLADRTEVVDFANRVGQGIAARSKSCFQGDEEELRSIQSTGFALFDTARPDRAETGFPGFVVIGAVSYVFQNFPTKHVTTFAYSVTRAGPNWGDFPRPFFPREDRHYMPDTELVIERDAVGVFAD
jgi:hypothetical protein